MIYIIMTILALFCVGFLISARNKQPKIINVENLLKYNKLDSANKLIVKILNRKDRIRYSVYAAELVIENYEKEYPKDSRPRQAIETAKAVIASDNENNRNAALTAAIASMEAAAEARSTTVASMAAAADAKSANMAAESATKLLAASYVAISAAVTAMSAMDYAARSSAVDALSAAVAAELPEKPSVADYNRLSTGIAALSPADYASMSADSAAESAAIAAEPGTIARESANRCAAYSIIISKIIRHGLELHKKSESEE